eukprot:COSAG01_NODE_4127_length_5326_cov_3.238569_8_plen_277_part_00
MHWVAVPQATRARRANRAPASVCARPRRSSAAWPPIHRAHLAARAAPAQFGTADVTHQHTRIQRRGGRSNACVLCARNELRPADSSGCPAAERPDSPAPACPHRAACQPASRTRGHLHALAALAHPVALAASKREKKRDERGREDQKKGREGEREGEGERDSEKEKEERGRDAGRKREKERDTKRETARASLPPCQGGKCAAGRASARRRAGAARGAAASQPDRARTRAHTAEQQRAECGTAGEACMHASGAAKYLLQEHGVIETDNYHDKDRSSG